MGYALVWVRALERAAGIGRGGRKPKACSRLEPSAFAISQAVRRVSPKSQSKNKRRARKTKPTSKNQHQTKLKKKENGKNPIIISSE